MIKILFVCHGNICRSPMAEMIFAEQLRAAGLKKEFAVSSAAVSTEETGNPLYPPARQVLERHGVPVLPHAARQITKKDYEEQDLILMMENTHLRRAERLLGGDPQGKMRLLGTYGRQGEIEDPWYTGRFERVYEQLELCCRALLNTLTQEKQDRKEGEKP